jgi:hypothetical protein
MTAPAISSWIARAHSVFRDERAAHAVGLHGRANHRSAYRRQRAARAVLFHARVAASRSEGRLHGAPLGGYWMHVGDPKRASKLKHDWRRRRPAFDDRRAARTFVRRPGAAPARAPASAPFLDLLAEAMIAAVARRRSVRARRCACAVAQPPRRAWPDRRVRQAPRRRGVAADDPAARRSAFGRRSRRVGRRSA